MLIFFQLKYGEMNILFILMTRLQEEGHLKTGLKSQHGKLDPLLSGVAIIVLNSTHRAFTEDPVAQALNLLLHAVTTIIV